MGAYTHYMHRWKRVTRLWWRVHSGLHLLLHYTYCMIFWNEQNVSFYVSIMIQTEISVSESSHDGSFVDDCWPNIIDSVIFCRWLLTEHNFDWLNIPSAIQHIFDDWWRIARDFTSYICLRSFRVFTYIGPQQNFRRGTWRSSKKQ